MRTGIGRVAAAAAAVAAVIAVAVSLSYNSKTAYAIEQTIAANKSIRSIHVKTVDPGLGDPQEVEHQQELWAEIDGSGRITRLRVEEGLGTDARVSVEDGDEGTLRYWRPAKNEFRTRYTFRAGGEIPDTTSTFDPREAAEMVNRLVAERKMSIEISQPKGGDIELTLKRVASPQDLPTGWAYPKMIVRVDPVTKLLKERDDYIIRDGQERLLLKYLYLGYNDAIDPAMFVLEPPEGTQIDDRTVDVGLPQGNMTDAEAAVAVVRAYIEARVAGDYKKAAKLKNGTSAEELRNDETSHKVRRWTRLVSTGQPVAAPDWGQRVYLVPYEFEFEKADGTIELYGPPSQHWETSGPWEHRKASARPTPKGDRWVVDFGP